MMSFVKMIRLSCCLLTGMLLFAFTPSGHPPTDNGKALKYSCDAKIDKWVKSNLRKVNLFNRATIAKYSPDYQLAIFIALSPEAKVNVWKEKFRLALNDDNYTAAEKEHIRQLNDILKPSIYGSGAEEMAIKAQFENWQEEARTNFGWDDKKLFFLGGTLMTEEEFKQMRTGLETNRAPNCNCLRGSIWSCIGGECVWAACSPTPKGCGWVGGNECNGACLK